MALKQPLCFTACFLQERINAERSGKSFVSGIGASSLLSRLSYSLGYSNQHSPPLRAEASNGMGWWVVGADDASFQLPLTA